jgi:hypothetical protein
LAINYTDGKLFYKDNSSTLQVIGWKTTPTTAGGTGLTSYTAGDLPYYASGSALSKLGIGTNGYVLESNGSAPTWVAQSTLSVGSATNATNVATTDNTSSSSTYYPTLVSATSGNNGITTSSTKLSFVPSTGVLTTTGHNITGLTASSAVATDASKNLISVTNTGTGNNVLATSPTLVTPTINTLSSASSTNLVFQTNGGTTAVTILSSNQYVGLGQSSPQDYLDVYGNARIGQGQISSDNSVGVFSLYGGLVGSATPGQIKFFGKSVSNTGQTYEISRISGISASTDYSLAGGIQFQVASNNGFNVLTLAECGRFNTNGYLLIGYTSSNGSYKLQVNSQIFATSSTIATSDANYKTNVTPLNNVLTLVNKLNPVSFNWKKHPIHNFDTENVTVGFLAQEVQTALSSTNFVNSIVKENICTITPAIKDENNNVITPAITESFLGIAEGNMISILTKAIQELSAQVTTLQSQVIALQEKIGT